MRRRRRRPRQRPGMHCVPAARFVRLPPSLTIARSKARIAVLADYASLSIDHKLNIMGIFTTINAAGAGRPSADEAGDAV